MELEIHQFDRRDAARRVRQPTRARRRLASLADVGQQMPIVVVRTESRYGVVDGPKRVRGLHRLHRDTVAAVIWEMAPAEALILCHLLPTDAPEHVCEQAWLLRTLHEEHGLALDVVARRFDRSVSWVSRRLSLVRTLPDTIQQPVREGCIAAPAAMTYLVPLARAQGDDCLRLAAAIAPHRLTTRQIGRLYQHDVGGLEATRALVLTDPMLVFRLTDETAPPRIHPDASAPEALTTDFHGLGAVARRAHRRLQPGGGLLPPERARAGRVVDQVQADVHDLQRRCDQELHDARPGTAPGDFERTGEGPRDPTACAGPRDLAGHGPDGPEHRPPDGATA